MINRTNHKPKTSNPRRSLRLLRESEARYRSIVEDQTEFVNRFRPDGTVTFVNEACCRCLGKKYDEIVGSNFFPLLQEEDRERLRKLLLSLTTENPVAAIEHRVITPSGETAWQQWTNRAIFDEEGNIIEYLAVGRDITKLRQTEQALAESEELYRSLFENTPVGIGIADMNGDLIAFNDAMLSPGGYTRDDIAKIQNVSALYYDGAERNRVLETVRKQGYLHQYPVKFKRKDGTPYDTLLSLRFVKHKGKPCLQAMVEDITVRKNVEEVLRQSEQRYRLLFADSPISVLELEVAAARKYLTSLKASGIEDFAAYLDNHMEQVRYCLSLMEVIDANSETLKLFDAGTIEEFREGFNNIFCEESFSGVKESLVALSENRTRFEFETVGRTLKGDRIDMFVKWFSAPGFRQEPQRATVCLIDISRLKSAEKALLESDQRFRLALENSPIVVFNQDRDLRFTWIYNPRHGYSKEFVLGKTDTDLFHIEDPQRLSELKRGVIESGVPVREEVKIQLGDQILFYDLTVEPLRGIGGNIDGITCVAIDITERKKSEDLIRSYGEQLSLLTSRLSSVEEKERRKIATELHDNIGQILACARMMLEDLEKSAQDNIRESIRKSRSLIEDSIGYTRSLSFELCSTLLYEMGLDAAVEWLGEQFVRKHGINFHFKDDGENKPLDDEIRAVLFQSVRELLANVAKHAQAKHVAVSLQRSDSSVTVTVEDDGVGFDASAVRDGSFMKCGFGLFSVSERLRNIGGQFEVESRPGSATRISLTAPIKDNK
ncbi:MAG: PAS domain S-box protein [Nitrospirota bacterium]